MPLPTPRRREGQDDFISRCMANPTARRDFPDSDQRAGMCFSQWRDRTDNMKLHELTANTLAGYEARYEMRQGRQHIVAPVVMLVEGVHDGTAGPIYYPMEELRAFPGAWDGRPVTLGHPEHADDLVSASSPEMMDRFALGVLFNTFFDPDRGLISEIWVDVERARRLAPEVVGALIEGRPLEVSTGLWFEESGGPGVWNGEEFTYTARDFRPDHLALLPDNVGACSIHDGCGVRANKGEDCGCSTDPPKIHEQEDSDMAEEKGLMRFMRSFLKSQETKDEAMAAVMEQLAANKPGMLGTIRALQQELDALDRDMPNGMLLHFLEDAFDDGTFVMRQSGPDGTTFFKGEFTVDNDSGEVEIGNDFTEVREEREFVEMQQRSETQTQTEEEETDMSISKEVFVNTLIGCDRSHFTEDHREFLMGLEESALEKLGPVDPPEGNEAEEASEESQVDAAPGADEGQGEVSEEGAAEASAEGQEETEEEQEETEEKEPTALEQFVSKAPEEFRGILEDAVKANEEKKEGLVRSILEASGNKFTEEQLQAKGMDELEALESLAGGKDEEDALTENVDIGKPMGRMVNFSGKAAANIADNENGESPPMGRSSIADQVGKPN